MTSIATGTVSGADHTFDGVGSLRFAALDTSIYSGTYPIAPNQVIAGSNLVCASIDGGSGAVDNSTIVRNGGGALPGEWACLGCIENPVGTTYRIATLWQRVT